MKPSRLSRRPSVIATGMQESLPFHVGRHRMFPSAASTPKTASGRIIERTRSNISHGVGLGTPGPSLATPSGESERGFRRDSHASGDAKDGKSSITETSDHEDGPATPGCTVGRRMSGSSCGGSVVRDSAADEGDDNEGDDNEDGQFELGSPTNKVNFDSYAGILKMPPGERAAAEVQSLMQLVSGVKFFNDLEEDLRKKACRFLSYYKAEQNQVLFRKGDKGNLFYVIVSGHVDVLLGDTKSVEREIAHPGCTQKKPEGLPDLTSDGKGDNSDGKTVTTKGDSKHAGQHSNTDSAGPGNKDDANINADSEQDHKSEINKMGGTSAGRGDDSDTVELESGGASASMTRMSRRHGDDGSDADASMSHSGSDSESLSDRRSRSGSEMSDTIDSDHDHAGGESVPESKRSYTVTDSEHSHSDDGSERSSNHLSRSGSSFSQSRSPSPSRSSASRSDVSDVSDADSDSEVNAQTVTRSGGSKPGDAAQANRDDSDSDNFDSEANLKRTTRSSRTASGNDDAATSNSNSDSDSETSSVSDLSWSDESREASSDEYATDSDAESSEDGDGDGGDAAAKKANTVTIFKLKPGQAFGELALINDAPRAATIRCETDCIFLTLDATSYQNVLKSHHVQEKLHDIMHIVEKQPEARSREEINELQKAVSKVKFFKELNKPDLMVSLCRLFSAEQHHAGHVVFNRGDPGEKWYLVLSGAVEVLVRGNTASETTTIPLGQGDGFGELALLNDARRAATVRCSDDCVFLTLSKNQYRSAVQDAHMETIRKEKGWSVKLKQILKKVPSRRTHTDIDLMLSAVNTVQFVSKLKPDVQREVCRFFGMLEVAEGDVIFEKGSQGELYYVVMDGSVDVDIDGVVVAKIGAGFGFGELALLNNNPRAATIVANKPTFMLTLKKEHYTKVLAQVHMQNVKDRMKWITYIFPALLQTPATVKRLAPLVSYFENQTYRPHEFVVRQGELNKTVGFILKGTLEVSLEIVMKRAPPKKPKVTAAATAARNEKRNANELEGGRGALSNGEGAAAGGGAELSRGEEPRRRVLNSGEGSVAPKRVTAPTQRKFYTLLHLQLYEGYGLCELFRAIGTAKKYAFTVRAGDGGAEIAKIKTTNMKTQIPLVVRKEQYGASILLAARLRDAVMEHLETEACNGWRPCDPIDIASVIPYDPSDVHNGKMDPTLTVEPEQPPPKSVRPWHQILREARLGSDTGKLKTRSVSPPRERPLSPSQGVPVGEARMPCLRSLKGRDWHRTSPPVSPRRADDSTPMTGRYASGGAHDDTPKDLRQMLEAAASNTTRANANIPREPAAKRLAAMLRPQRRGRRVVEPGQGAAAAASSNGDAAWTTDKRPQTAGSSRSDGHSVTSSRHGGKTHSVAASVKSEQMTSGSFDWKKGFEECGCALCYTVDKGGPLYTCKLLDVHRMQQGARAQMAHLPRSHRPKEDARMIMQYGQHAADMAVQRRRMRPPGCPDAATFAAFTSNPTGVHLGLIPRLSSQSQIGRMTDFLNTSTIKVPVDPTADVNHKLGIVGGKSYRDPLHAGASAGRRST